MTTLARIARAAWMNAPNEVDHWEVTASAIRAAVIEECAKVAESIDPNAQDVAEAIRHLEDTP